MNLHISSVGSGPNLVFLHGWGMHGGVWHMISEELSRHFCVHCVDLPGHGKSGMCNPYSLESISEILSTSLPQSVSVCGWSFGGQLALQWAATTPQQVKRLILVSVTPRFIRCSDWEHGMEASVFDEFAFGLSKNRLLALRRFNILQAYGDAAERAVARALQEHYDTVPPQTEALNAGLKLLRENDLRDRLHSIRQPSLIVHGECDAVIPLAAGVRLSQALPNARLATMQMTAHAPFLSRVDEFIGRITEFCNER